MLRSLFSGVAGLRNHQVKMDVLGNNIANVNTYGFKASRVTFQEIYAQSLRSASQPSANLGGRNPMQVGLGISTATIDVIHSSSQMQVTDHLLDLSITGEGFFAVKQGEITNYTRTGNFYLNPTDGALIAGNGFFVQGFMFLDEGDYPDLEFTQINFDDTIAPGYDIEADLDSVGRIFVPEGFEDIAIDARGLITGIDANGDLVEIGQILVTNFINPSGLTRVGSNLYLESNNSGTPNVGFGGDPTFGMINSSSLEMSNVDLSKEFTDMIITQRGFQANSRIITVSDTLLEELINLKR